MASRERSRRDGDRAPAVKGNEKRYLYFFPFFFCRVLLFLVMVSLLQVAGLYYLPRESKLRGSTMSDGKGNRKMNKSCSETGKIPNTRPPLPPL